MAVIAFGVNDVRHQPDSTDEIQLGTAEVRIQPSWVGLCGSDFHLVDGSLVPPAVLGPVFPRTLGHEFSGIVVEVGADVTSVRQGDKVAVWPLTESCGSCVACQANRPNACPTFRLTGIHAEGALSSAVVVDEQQVFVLPEHLSEKVGALCEPLSISLSAVEKANISSQDTVLITGGGAIGLGALLAAQDRGARVVLSEPNVQRRNIAVSIGADAVADGTDESISEALQSLGADKVHQVLECTGLPACVRQGASYLAPMGHLTLVGLSSKDFSVPISLIARSEISIFGSSVCNRDTFGRAVELAGRKEKTLEQLISHVVTPADVPDLLNSPVAPEHIKVLVSL